MNQGFVIESGRIPHPLAGRVALAVTDWWQVLAFRTPARWWIRLDSWNHVLALAVLAAAASVLPQSIRGDRLPTTGDGAGQQDLVQGARTVDGTAAPPSFDPARLFGRPARKETASKRTANVTLTELSRHLSLVGLIGEEPVRAVLLDQRDGQTIQVSPGDFVGEIQIREVRRDGVVLAWKSETLELAF